MKWPYHWFCKITHITYWENGVGRVCINCGETIERKVK